jgi:hypothetical protein
MSTTMCSMPLEPVGLLAGEAANASVFARLVVKMAAPEAPMIWRNVRRENMARERRRARLTLRCRVTTPE